MKKLFHYLMLAAGSFFTALGLNAFLIPNKIAAGGVSGIATIIFVKTGVPVGLSTLLLDAALFLAGWKFLPKKSLFQTMLSAFLLSLFLYLTRNLVIPTGDMLISALYGGAIVGFGLGLVIINGASTGGTDLLAVMVNRAAPHVSVAKIMLIVDTIIIVSSAIAFADFSLIFYAVLSLGVSVKVTDYLIDGVNFAKSALIITTEYEKVSEALMEQLSRGVTGLYAKGMYTKQNVMALLCIVKPREVSQIRKIVHGIDKNAFVILTDVNETLGEGFKEIV